MNIYSHSWVQKLAAKSSLKMCFLLGKCLVVELPEWYEEKVKFDVFECKSYLEMVLEFERLSASGALEFAQIRPVRMVCHVPLELGQIWELLSAHGAWLGGKKDVKYADCCFVVEEGRKCEKQEDKMALT